MSVIVNLTTRGSLIREKRS